MTFSDALLIAIVSRWVLQFLTGTFVLYLNRRDARKWARRANSSE